MLPDWLPQTLWDEFKKHRQKIKAPMTEYAEDLILAKLERFKAEGLDPISSINQSIEYSYRGVFPPKNGHAAPQVLDGQAARPGLSMSSPAVCCMCGCSLETGFIHTSKGRKCHDC
jgi:hypothetical protein